MNKETSGRSNGRENYPRFSPQPHKTTSPLGSFFHPTRATLDSGDQADSSTPSSHWSSRASRKNRYPQTSVPLSRRMLDNEKGLGTGPSHVTVNERIRHPHHKLKPYLAWDISFWVAVMFVVGSAAWICNGHLLYTPLSPTPSPPHANAAAWLAFVGGSFFELGAYLAYVEALNAGHEQMFVELRRALDREKQRKGLVSDDASEDRLVDGRKGKYRFRWMYACLVFHQDLLAKRLFVCLISGTCSPRDIGYLASIIQLFAATIFWVSTISGLPQVIPSLATAWPPSAITIVFFWTPQVIGGCGFIIASLLLMFEEQKRWWKIEPLRIGWHVAFWNLVGAVGFTLCGALGYASTRSTKVRASYLITCSATDESVFLLHRSTMSLSCPRSGAPGRS